MLGVEDEEFGIKHKAIDKLSFSDHSFLKEDG